MVFKAKIIDKSNFAVFTLRKNATVAIVYQDYLTIHKLAGGKSDPIMTVQFKGALQDLELSSIQFYQMDEKFIYILSKDILYIINLEEQMIEQPQIVGTNVKHFMIFEDRFIYWLEKRDHLTVVKFDYFNPKQGIKLIDWTLFTGAN